MKQLVIFDLDGTLLNTIGDLGCACNHALAAAGFAEHSLGSYNMMVGGGVAKLIERALPAEARDEDTRQRVLRLFMRYYDEHLFDLTTVYPGIDELLRELVARDVKLAVSSNKYNDAVHRLIQHFFGDLPWAAVYGNIEGVPVKPDPSIVFEVLTTAPTLKSQVLYAGDSAVDIETARRACVESCGVTWGFRSRAELTRAGADHIVTAPAQILDLI